MEYWVIINEEQTGPLTLEELLATDLTADTPVWHEGLETWMPARNIAALEAMFASQAPAQEPVCAAAEPVAERQAPSRPCPPTYLVWAILTTLLCCTPFGIAAIVYATQVKRYYKQGDYSKARKASERAALWVILAFVLGLIYLPFSSVISMI